MASDPFAVGLDAEPSSIEPESLLPRLLLETPTRPETTPKRKRGEAGDDQDDVATPTKRSNLEKGLIPDSFDMSSDGGSFGSGNGQKAQQPKPMKRSNDPINTAAPTTPTRTANGFHVGTSPASVALLDKSPFPLATSALSPLIRPRISDYTSIPEPAVDKETVSSASDPLMNNEVSSGSAHDGSDHGVRTKTSEKQCPPPFIDMDLSAAGHDDIFYEFRRTAVSQPARDQCQEDTNPKILPTPQCTPQKNHTATTTTTTPQKHTSTLHRIPAIAPAYVPEYLSTNSPVKLKDPKQFCIRPPFWKRWPTNRYVQFATFLQETINLVPFAEQEGLTVEEVQHVFRSIVTEPLLDETDKLAAVGAKRMGEIFKLFNRKGGSMKWRTWRSEANSVQGELCGVRPGVVQLANENGELIEVPYKKLVQADQELVLEIVTSEERGVLLREDSSA